MNNKTQTGLFIRLTHNQLHALQEALETYSQGKKTMRVSPEVSEVLNIINLTIENNGFIY